MKLNSKTPPLTSVIARLGLAAVLSAVTVQPAWALTGGDVLDGMSSDESTGYMAGSIAMAAMIAGANGSRERAECIMNWYYEGDGVEEIVQALDHFKDREAQPVIYALINRACGE